MKSIFKEVKWLFSYMASILMYAILVILLFVGVLLVAYYVDSSRSASRGQVPLYGAYVILTGSMEPVIKPGDAVLIRRAAAEDIKEGDVVTYFATDPAYYGILITHRVVNVKYKNGHIVYVTKGDHNPTVDNSEVDSSQVYGKVIMRIPKIGHLKYFLVSSYGWLIVIVIPCVGIIVYDCMKAINKGSSSKKRSKEL